MFIDTGFSGRKYSIVIHNGHNPEYVKSEKMELLADYVKKKFQSGKINESIIVDCNAIGRYFADCLDKVGVKYIPMKFLGAVDLDKNN